jgi:hypothetical protein
LEYLFDTGGHLPLSASNRLTEVDPDAPGCRPGPAPWPINN